jgi:hypothetical protein
VIDRDRFYRTLVLLNTAVLGAGLVLGCLFVAYKRQAIQDSLRSVLARESASSKLLEVLDLGAGSPTDLDYPVYQIRIHPNDLRNVQTQVRALTEAGIMTDDLKRWHPAKFFHENEEYDVKIRLRGDFPNHWSGEKKSWRVRFKRDHLFLGRREIDLIIPIDKSYEVELIAYEAARALGLLVPDAGFCKLRINGIDFGTYLWIEKYGAEMLEKQGYPVGEIFRNQNVWTQTRRTGFGVWAEEHSSAYRNSVREDPAVGYDAARWHDFVSLVREAEDDEFRREILRYVDMEKLLRWNALTWLFGSDHSHGADNLRWYYDDTVALFEPILYDVNRYPIRLPPRRPGGLPRWVFETGESNLLVRRIMQVPAHRQRRNQLLWTLLQDERFDMEARSDHYYRQIEPFLASGAGNEGIAEVERYHEQTIEILRGNREDLRAQLEFARVFVTPLLMLDRGRAALRLLLVPDSRSFIELERVDIDWAEAMPRSALATPPAVRLVDPEGIRRPVDARIAPGGEDDLLALELTGATLWTPVDEGLAQQAGEWQLEVLLDGVDPLVWQTPGLVRGLELRLRNSISARVLEPNYVISSPLIYRFENEESLRGATSLAEFLARSALPFTREGDTLALAPGVHTLTRTLRLPDGIGLRLAAGTTLRMGSGVSLIVRGPLSAMGREGEPVRVVPANDRNPWGSVAVVRSPEPSDLRHIEVRGGSDARVDGLNLTGQLCFYRSEVRLSDCTISGAHADDGLNVKRATAVVERCVFRDNASDGYDADWVEGAVVSSSFIDNGGDGLDISGSRIAIRGSLFDGMGDKAISVGEKSEVLAYDDVIRDSVIGVASKDLSRTRLFATTFHGNETALALYRKKPLFGGATGEVVGSLFWGNRRNLAVDGESRVTVLASAADRWEEENRSWTTDLITEDPRPFFRIAPNGSVYHDPASLDRSPFRIQVATEPAELWDVAVPDLAGSPTGGRQPLRVPGR